MRSATFLRFLFVFYCVEAGVFLLMAPWSEFWDRVIFQVPIPVVHAIYLHPVFRGAISGLGAVHILWGAHDLEDWLAHRQVR